MCLLHLVFFFYNLIDLPVQTIIIKVQHKKKPTDFKPLQNEKCFVMICSSFLFRRFFVTFKHMHVYEVFKYKL